MVIETSDWRPEHRIQLWDTLDEVTRQAAAADAEVVLVLDATHAEHRAELATRYPRVRIVQGPEGDGYYANKHRGILEAHGELVVLTDANCMPQPGWLAAAIGTFNGRDPSVGVV